jgi:GNAT superfamily N-acetyltransferase
MASIEPLRLSRFGDDDLAGCVALSAEAGWNQNEDDWALFVRHGMVFGLSDARGPVATGAILPYPDAFGWISMVLVTARRRRERIGTRILEACCAELTRRGLVAVLDATPAGERVYRPLGFEPMFGLSRWQGEGGGDAGPAAGVRQMVQSDLPAVAAVDAAAFGAARPFVLETLYRRAPHIAVVSECHHQQVDAFALARPGRLATQIGPVVAPDEDVAADLLDAALRSVRGPVFLDVAERSEALKHMLARRNFTIQRPFLRMALRRRNPFGNPGQMFVVAGPELG